MRALENGLDDFLAKTASAPEIVAKIRSAARRIDLKKRLHVQNAALRAMALTDELTGIANRRALFSAAAEMLRISRRVSAAIFDIDRFKEINDAHGHLVGDRVLAGVAQALKGCTRVGDLLARYGGDEFVLLLPETSEREARQIANRIRKSIAELVWQPVSGGKPIHVTASVGVSTSTSSSRLEPAELIDRADTELLRAKRHLAENDRPRRTRKRKVHEARPAAE